MPFQAPEVILTHFFFKRVGTNPLGALIVLGILGPLICFGAVIVS